MIAYDTHVLVYALDRNGEWAHAAQDVVRQGERDGAVLSVLAWQELLTGALLKGSDLENAVTGALCALGATRFMPVTQAIVERALDLTRRYGKQAYGYDAIHLATALEHRVSVFITNDKALLGLHIEGLDIREL
jgi:predicted nucleic acid-binding protein